MTPTKEDIKKWLKDIGRDRFWLAEQCKVDKRTVDSWLSSDRALPARAIILINQLMTPNTVEKEGRNLRRVETLTLQFSKSEWEDVLEYQKLYPKKTVQELAEEFVLNLSASLQKGISQIIPEVEKMEIAPVMIASLESCGTIIGNIAAGNLADGDTIPQDIRLYRDLEKGEYLLRVNGHSMEPAIADGSVVIMRKHTIPPIPKVGSIVQYHDERGVTLKKLSRKKNPETGKWDYTLHPLNPAFGDIEPMDGGKISGIYVETLDRWEKA